jgi:hypothetical protein
MSHGDCIAQFTFLVGIAASAGPLEGLVRSDNHWRAAFPLDQYRELSPFMRGKGTYIILL